MDTTKDGLIYLAGGRCPKNAENSYQYLLVRLLIGSLEITKNSIKVNQKLDFSILPYTLQSKVNTGAFADFLSSSGIVGTPQKFINSTLADNREFFRELLAEFGNYFIQSKRGNHATAFVHLYRSLERILYSIPLLYSSTTVDFIGTFNELKSLFKEDLGGELGFFKKFLHQGKFIDKLVLDTTSTITFSSVNGYQIDYLNLTDRIYKNFHSIDAINHQVSLSFKNTPEFLTSLRNRLFHARTGDGKTNVRMQEVLDIDEYLNCMNPTFCNFLAFVTLQIIALKYQN